MKKMVHKRFALLDLTVLRMLLHRDLLLPAVSTSSRNRLGQDRVQEFTHDADGLRQPIMPELGDRPRRTKRASVHRNELRLINSLGERV